MLLPIRFWMRCLSLRCLCDGLLFNWVLYGIETEARAGLGLLWFELFKFSMLGLLDYLALANEYLAGL